MQERPRSQSFDSVGIGDKQAPGGRALLSLDHGAEGDRRFGVNHPPHSDELVDIHTLLEDPLGISLFRR